MSFFKGLIQGLRLNNGVSKFAEEHIELVQALTLPTPHTPRATSDTRHILSRNRFLILLRIHTTIVDYALRIQQTHWTVLIGHFYCGKAHRIQTDVNSYPVTLPPHKTPFTVATMHIIVLNIVTVRNRASQMARP